ncbi:glycosyltransferase, partial [bacterium]|nr:glycosyltransferase [bacterium]
YPRIHRLGFVPLEHMPSLYHYASIFIYPSIYEGFGLPVLEALCSSAVVLTSNVTSLAEIAGNVVKTFNPFDTMSIAEAILTASVMTREASVEYRKKIGLAENNCFANHLNDQPWRHLSQTSQLRKVAYHLRIPIH